MPWGKDTQSISKLWTNGKNGKNRPLSIPVGQIPVCVQDTWANTNNLEGYPYAATEVNKTDSSM